MARDGEERNARWEKVASVFAAALTLPARRRPTYLERRLADDPTLRPEIESLLAADGEAARFLETPALNAWAELWRSCSPRQPPIRGVDRIGPYRILRTLGRGGMGTVHLAVRADDEYEKQVAIKLAHGTPADEMLRRFRAERQILANLEHPNVARLLDGGTTEAGSPYLVMEYVEGTAVDEYCDQRGLAAGERLELFLRVCGAVEHAHRNLVVHRDLKPGNILVTAEGEPKLLDFGIAKLLEPEPAAAGNETTLQGLRPLTPNYASPEQLRGQPVSTATDVYSLGVLLYRLLTGRLPRLFRALTPAEIESAMAQEPAPPCVDRDLDAVVLKALAVEPDRRYASVEQLAADLRRWVEGRPILARPQTLRYRAAKFLRRHMVAAAATAGVAALLLGFSVDKTRQARRIAEERDRARVEADKARELAGFLADLLRGSDPWRAAGREVTVREVLDRGAEEIRRLDAGPELRGMLLDTMGTIYLQLARFDEARTLLEDGLAQRRQALPADHPEVGVSLHHLGMLSLSTGRYDEAEALYREALAVRRGRSEPLPVAESLHGLGQTFFAKSAYAAAETAHREALELRLAALGEGHLEVAASREALAALYTEIGRLPAADELFRKVLATRRRLLPSDHPQVAETLQGLAALRRRQDDLEDAEALLREVVAIRRRVFGDAHPQVGTALHDLAGVLMQRGELAEAEELYLAVLDISRVLGEEHRDVAVVHYKVGQLRQAQGDLDGAESYYRHSLEIVRGSLPEGHPGAAYPLLGLAALHLLRREPELAEPLVSEALELRLRALPADHPEIAQARAALEDCRARIATEDP